VRASILVASAQQQLAEIKVAWHAGREGKFQNVSLVLLFDYCIYHQERIGQDEHSRWSCPRVILSASERKWG